MIRHISLKNWRAYRQLSLDVAPGTTFLVAPNGIGKTSLLEAVRWALTAGAIADTPSMIRYGHDEATVTVILATAQGELTLRRTLRSKRARLSSVLKGTIAGEDVPEADLPQLLEQTWSADSRFVSRTAFLTEDLRRNDRELDLESHLCRAYSLDDLQRAIAEIEVVLGETNRALKAARADLTATDEELASARRQHDQLIAEMDGAQAALTTARTAHTAVRQQLEQAAAEVEKRSAALGWEARYAELIRDVEPLLGRVESDVLVDTALTATEESLKAEFEILRAEQAQLRAKLEAVESSLATLNDADATCPVCLRELDDESREHAEHLHQGTLDEVWAQLAHIAPTGIPERLDAVREFRRRAAVLGDQPESGRGEETEPLVIAEADALAHVEAAAALVREVELGAVAAKARADAIAEELSEASTLTRQYRTIALLEAAKAALQTTITSVLAQQLAPVADEVSRRWQAVFPDRPYLRLATNGQMTRDVGVESAQLPFDAFSTGEQTVASLMMRVTTLMSTTTIPFCFVDEPLEHLDPRSRRLVGSTLAHLSAPGGLEQILVTTYEEPLARRLAELQPERVRIQYLRAELSR